MSTIEAIQRKAALVIDDNDKEGSSYKMYSVFFNYYISSDALNEYEKAIKLLDKSTLDKFDQWILFTGFNTITSRDIYNKERRNKLCNFWLPIYENTLKQLIPTEQENTDHLPLNAIKYIITNILRMQLTSENLDYYLKSTLQFLDFEQRNEYFSIIKLVLPLLYNSNIIEGVEKDDHTNINLEWKENELSNTANITPTFIVWIISKLIIMFVNTDGDCLTMVKHDKNIKITLINSLEQIKNNRTVELSLYTALTLIMNEEDVENEIEDPKHIITILINSINERLENDSKLDTFSISGVHIIDLIIGLKAYLQHDQVKNDFLESNGIELLIKLTEGVLEPSEIDSNNSENLEDEKESKPEVLQKIVKTKESLKIEMKNLLKELAILALECLFVMSFNKEAVEIIKKNDKFMSGLRKLANEINTTPVKNEHLKVTVDGILWKLEKEDQFIKQQKKPTKRTNKNEFDIMISYSWSDKPLIHDIYKHLTEQFNYRIWLDENQMAGSLCQAMAQAVEKSKFVLMCMSETYKTSENCRNEAEYARDRNKTIIPLVVKKVQRDGWLGFISAGKMYIDFSRQDFEKAVQLLKAEIDRHLLENGEQIQPVQQKEKTSTVVTSTPQVTTTSTPVVSKLPIRPNVISDAYKNVSIELWSNEHVQHFLYDNNLDTMILLTENMNGDELNLLLQKCEREQDYWIMFERLNKELEKRHQQILPISVYIRFLNQTQKYTNVSLF